MPEPDDISKAEALSDSNATTHTDRKTVRKVTVVPGEFVNIVAN